MNIIKSTREARSLSQKRLAAMSGIDPRTLRKVEKGEEVSPETYRAICMALSIPAQAQNPTYTHTNKSWKWSNLILIGGHVFIWGPVMLLTLIIAVPAAIITAPNTSIVVSLDGKASEPGLGQVRRLLEKYDQIHHLGNPSMSVVNGTVKATFNAQLSAEHYSGLSEVMGDNGFEASISTLK